MAFADNVKPSTNKYDAAMKASSTGMSLSEKLAAKKTEEKELQAESGTPEKPEKGARGVAKAEQKAKTPKKTTTEGASEKKKAKEKKPLMVPKETELKTERTTILLTKSEREKLQKVKEKYGFRSINQVIEALVETLDI